MNINYKAENKQLNLEKRNKQNSGIAKPLMYTGLSIASVAAISIIGKILYDKSRNKEQKIIKINDKFQVGNVILDAADMKWINDYIVVFRQVHPLCWHNASMQYLACPEIRAKKFMNKSLSGDPNRKIISMINYINEIFENKNRPNCFKGNVDVDRSKRQVADGDVLKDQKGSFLFGKKAIADVYNGWYAINHGIMDAILSFDFNSHFSSAKNYTTYFIDNYSSIIANVSARGFDYGILSANNERNELKNFIVDFGVPDMENVGKDVLSKFFGKNDINFLQDKGYYPTFVAVWDDVVEYSFCPHWMAYYIVYDKERNIKYFIQADGCKSGIRLMTKEEGLNQLKKYKKNVVKYSSKDVVEEFYTPEFLEASSENINIEA